MTEGLSSPELFRKWTAISLVGGAMERKVWANTSIGTLYPNLYVVLVGPPGVGKTVMTAVAGRLWKDLPGQHVAPSNVSPASLYDEMKDATRSMLKPEGPVIFNSLKVSSDELGVFLPTYDLTFMSALQALYDCHPFSERKRTGDRKYLIEKPQLHMLAATNPSFLKDLMPDAAWEQGFASRTLFIYSGETETKDIFTGQEGVSDSDYAILLNDLKSIGEMYGKMTWEPEAMEAIRRWHLAKGPPRPDHPRLINYLTRRTAHLIKLCMVSAASRANSLLMTVEDYRTALSWLIEAETYMTEIFKVMSSGGDGKIMKECWHFAFQLWMGSANKPENRKPVPEYQLVEFLSDRTDSFRVGQILDVMVRGKLFSVWQEPQVGRVYLPREPRKTL